MDDDDDIDPDAVKIPMKVEPWDQVAFEALDQNFPPQSVVPKGAQQKNRYGNILPNPRTRVKLPQAGSDPSSTYINANYIAGYSGFPHEYIATQGPKRNTVVDFWRMIWECRVKVIVMVTGLIEKGVEKCTRYWPTVLYNFKKKLGDKKYGPFVIRVVAGAKKDGFVTSSMIIRLGDEERKLTHFWYDTWPDHGVPHKTMNVCTMLKAVDAVNNDHDIPIVVHCSAGIGRTGTFIAIDMGLRMLDEKGSRPWVDFGANEWCLPALGTQASHISH